MTGDRFESTLRRLRDDRDEIEVELNRQIEALDGRSRAACEAAAHAEARALERLTVDGRTQARETTALPRDDGQGPLAPPEQPPWPDGRGLRGVLDRVLRWLLRDHLAVMDLRHLELSRALESRDSALQAARQRLADESERVRALDDRLAALTLETEAIREAMTRCVEVEDLVARALLQLRGLLNAKEAETVHVATEGARRRAELVFEELARQQEALLAELVGRRSELEQMIARLERVAGDG